jgi:hypothetical protein
MDTPIYEAVTNYRNVSIQEGRNLERQELIKWLKSQTKKTIKVEEIIKVLDNG